MTHGAPDPEVSRAMAEYLLMAETGLRPEEIDAMPEDRAALYMAIAGRVAEERQQRAPGPEPRIVIRRTE